MEDPQPVSKVCHVSPNDDLVLDIIIGNGQLGTSAVYEDAAVKDTGDFENYALGKGIDWAGHDLNTKTIVTDVNSATNRLVVTYRIRAGGKVAAEAANAFEVAKPNGSAVFLATFRIVAD